MKYIRRPGYHNYNLKQRQNLWDVKRPKYAKLKALKNGATCFSRSKVSEIYNLNLTNRFIMQAVTTVSQETEMSRRKPTFYCSSSFRALASLVWSIKSSLKPLRFRYRRWAWNSTNDYLNDTTDLVICIYPPQSRKESHSLKSLPSNLMKDPPCKSFEIQKESLHIQEIELSSPYVTMEHHSITLSTVIQETLQLYLNHKRKHWFQLVLRLCGEPAIAWWNMGFSIPMQSCLLSENSNPVI